MQNKNALKQNAIKVEHIDCSDVVTGQCSSYKHKRWVVVAYRCRNNGGRRLLWENVLDMTIISWKIIIMRNKKKNVLFDNIIVYMTNYFMQILWMTKQLGKTKCLRSNYLMYSDLELHTFALLKANSNLLDVAFHM